MAYGPFEGDEDSPCPNRTSIRGLPSRGEVFCAKVHCKLLICIVVGNWQTGGPAITDPDVNGLTPGTSRKRNTLLTQQKIVDAARAELSSNGFDAARIDIIARNAGVSRQLVYLYFGSKEGLYKAVLDDVAEEAAVGLEKIDYDGPVLDVLDQFIRTVFDDHQRTSAVMAVDTATHHAAWISPTSKVYEVAARFIAKIAEVLERGKAAGLIDGNADPAAFFAMASMSSVGPIIMSDMWTGYGPVRPMSFWRDYVAEMAIRSVLKIDGRAFPVEP